MLIFLYGPDTFRSREKLKNLKEKFLKEIDKSALNLEVLEGKGLEVNQFRQAVLSEAFLAKKRMIIIENLFFKSQKKLCHEILKTLTEVKNENIIIFWDGDVSINKLAESCQVLFKKMVAEKFSQKFELLKEPALRKFITDKVKGEKGKIEQKTVNILVDWLGNDLWQVNKELEKLLAFCKGKTITTNEVNLLTKSKLEENIFDLTDAMGHKNKNRALKLIHDQLDLGLAETVLLAKITWQFKNLLQIKALTEEKPGLTSSQIASQLRLHPYVVKKSLSQIRNFSLSELKKIYQQLLGVDFAIKTSQVPAETIFNLLVSKF